MSIIGLIILLVFIGVIMYVIPMDHRFKTLIYAIVALLVLVWLADAFLGGPRYDGCNPRFATRTTR